MNKFDRSMQDTIKGSKSWSYVAECDQFGVTDGHFQNVEL